MTGAAGPAARWKAGCCSCVGRFTWHSERPAAAVPKAGGRRAAAAVMRSGAAVHVLGEGRGWVKGCRTSQCRVQHRGVMRRRERPVAAAGVV